MANLFERLVKDTLTDSEDDQNNGISIHSFTGALNELRRGKITQQELKTAFNLTTAQSAEALVLKNLIVAAPDRIEFMRVLKDWLYMGEDTLAARYNDRAQFVARMEEEVTDQGGTLP